MDNHLKRQTSPYLLQHAHNPVNWYPWCEEAFEKAKKEDKPIFLSIGYSTCHWCHVMAHESFEDEQVADLLNRYFVSIKVDKEERPDIDSVYMGACQAFTGSGGWPATIFLTPDKKPFYAGTYFPKTEKYGQIGMMELVQVLHEKWEENRQGLLALADDVVAALEGRKENSKESGLLETFGQRLIKQALDSYRRNYDPINGGFGHAPKFPAPHNLLFLLRYYEKSADSIALQMVEKTLAQMYRGGLFDHIGGGFCRYSTDDMFLVPHFEKMLYDNAMLIMAYAKAFQITGKKIYRYAAEKTADYVCREMTAPEGGFYSAQDADSEGEEGKFYVFTPEEIIHVLGEAAGERFNQRYGISVKGNFEGKNIPNLLSAEDWDESVSEAADRLYAYRKKRFHLHLDDKILTGWNGLMAAAMCRLYRVTGNRKWLDAAKSAENFILNKLSEEDVLFVSYRKGRSKQKGFLEDYAFQILALLDLYECTLDEGWLKTAIRFYEKTIRDFYDVKCGGFYLYGTDHEQMILRPKETYDGAVFSGNSAMAYNMMRLGYLYEEDNAGLNCSQLAKQQMKFLAEAARHYPAGQAMFLTVLLDITEHPDTVTVVVPEYTEVIREKLENITCCIPLDTLIRKTYPTPEYPLREERTTFYICHGRSCQPPVNDPKEIFH